MKRLFFILLLIPFLSSCGGKSNKTNVPVVEALANDPELEQAQKEALANLDYFLKTFETNTKDTSFSFSLKADFIENDEHEHMWISFNKMENGQFQGYLENDPQILKNIKYGDLVKLKKEQIEDWIIFNSKDNKMEGGYSTKVFLEREKQ